MIVLFRKANKYVAR